MSHKHAGGCDHIHTHSDNGPIDSHTCHCSICKRVTGQDTTHVVFFNHETWKSTIWMAWIVNRSTTKTPMGR